MLPENPPLILIIEDDTRARSLLTASLMHAGYRVSQAATGNHGMAEFVVQKPDAIVLDLRLPDVAGTEVVRQVRERSSVPILAIADGDLHGEGTAAVSAGADAAVGRPFDIGEILAWLGQMLRTGICGCYSANEAPFRVGDLNVDLATQRVSVGDREIELSASEFLLLTTLMQHSGRVVTYRYLINQIWNSQHYWQIAYLKLLVSGLRRKLEQDPAHPRYVMTERGVGYRMAME